MVMQYIRTAFGVSGDRAAIPNDAQPDGSVSQTEGFPVDYQLDPGVDPDAKLIPRDKFNEVMYDTQVAIQQLQQDGFPEHITASMNGGAPYAYRLNATCRGTDGNNYYSLIAANTDVPPSANWGLVIYSESFKTGDTMAWDFTTIRAGGWLWQNGTTIGNATSGATQRANADTLALFTRYWNEFTNTVLPIQDSTGAASTRGVNAAADFAANKRLPLPDKCGRSHVGMDNMGGITAKNRVTVAGSGISGITVGATGGSETVQLTGNQNGTHAHTGTTDSSGAHTHTGVTDTAGAHTHTQITLPASEQDNPNPPLNVSVIGNNAGGIASTYSTGAGTNSAGDHTHTLSIVSAGAHTHTFTTNNSGLGEAHQNMPPVFIGGGWIVKI